MPHHITSMTDVPVDSTHCELQPLNGAKESQGDGHIILEAHIAQHYQSNLDLNCDLWMEASGMFFFGGGEEGDLQSIDPFEADT